MDPFNLAPIAAILDAAYYGILALADLISPLAGGASAALAIVAVTIIVRLVLIPVGASQVKAEWTRRRLAPELAKLQERFEKNPQKLQEKTMELYKREGTSPFAGMLPLLAQAPIVSIVYAVFIRASVDGHANALLTEHLLGVPLGATLLLAAWPGVLVFVGLAVVMAATGWWSRRVILRLNPATPAVLSWLSFLPLVFAAFVPLAAVLYLTVSGVWAQAERLLLKRRYWPSEP